MTNREQGQLFRLIQGLLGASVAQRWLLVKSKENPSEQDLHWAEDIETRVTERRDHLNQLRQIEDFKREVDEGEKRAKRASEKIRARHRWERFRQKIIREKEEKARIIEEERRKRENCLRTLRSYLNDSPCIERPMFSSNTTGRSGRVMPHMDPESGRHSVWDITQDHLVKKEKQKVFRKPGGILAELGFVTQVIKEIDSK